MDGAVDARKSPCRQALAADTHYCGRRRGTRLAIRLTDKTTMDLTSVEARYLLVPEIITLKYSFGHVFDCCNSSSQLNVEQALAERESPL